ncbi:MAG: FAD-dependent oxidoreductase [Propionicimonas sp.]|nr:FAD-dependent oxidoreductase [Propionicimonas sp.]
MDVIRTDLVVVGAGAAGLLAAVAARRRGLEVLVVEASGLAGGSTATGDGRLWLPANHLMGKLGIADSVEVAADYLDAVLGSPSVTSTPERRAAYAETAGKLGRWLASSKLPLVAENQTADHDLEAPGARSGGRVVHCESFDRRVLGEWDEWLRSPEAAGRSGLRNRVIGATLTRHASRSSGEALAGELLHRAIGTGVEIWLDSRVVDLVESGDGIGGVVVRRNVQGSDAEVGIEVLAGRGVLLAGNGFEANQQLREEYLPLPTDAAWSASGSSDDGGLLALAIEHGAATGALDEAWWTPVLVTGGRAYPLDQARRAPHSLIVDSAGSRFFNEAGPDTDAGRALYDRSRGVRAIPSFLIMDSRHRREVPLGPWAAGAIHRSELDTGDVMKASTLNDLAQQLGIDRAGLIGTVVQFNAFARKGVDQDYHRGEVPGARRKANASLGKVEKSPFWAVRVYPGDLGTKGGVLVDADGRVLRPDGSVIAGLHACGGTAASLMGRTSPGPGAALGEALVGAFRAVLKLSEAA